MTTPPDSHHDETEWVVVVPEYEPDTTSEGGRVAIYDGFYPDREAIDVVSETLDGSTDVTFWCFTKGEEHPHPLLNMSLNQAAQLSAALAKTVARHVR